MRINILDCVPKLHYNDAVITNPDKLYVAAHCHDWLANYPYEWRRKMLDDLVNVPNVADGYYNTHNEIRPLTNYHSVCIISNDLDNVVKVAKKHPMQFDKLFNDRQVHQFKSIAELESDVSCMDVSTPDI